MSERVGRITGIGVSATRKNEITADDLATERNFKIGWNYGVVNRSGYKFNAQILTEQFDTPTIELNNSMISTPIVEDVTKYKVYVDSNYKGYIDSNNIWHANGTDITPANNSLIIRQGIMFAYGYFGYVPQSTFEFVRPAIPQYYIIYAELDRSIIPNTCYLKAKNNKQSTSIETLFRQDNLSMIKTGIFQLPLWRVKVDINGIQELYDLRILRDRIKNVNSVNFTHEIDSEVPATVTATTPPEGDSSERIATTAFVCNEIEQAINY